MSSRQPGVRAPRARIRAPRRLSLLGAAMTIDLRSRRHGGGGRPIPDLPLRERQSRRSDRSGGKPRSHVEGMPHWIHARADAFNGHHRSPVITDRRSASRRRRVERRHCCSLVCSQWWAFTPTFVGAETQAEEKMSSPRCRASIKPGPRSRSRTGRRCARRPGRCSGPARSNRGCSSSPLPGTRERRQGLDSAVPGAQPACSRRSGRTTEVRTDS